MTFHEDMKYWVWLQRAAGKGANLERLLSPFGGDVRALYEADPGERERLLRETPSESADWQREEARGAGMRGGWMRDGWRADGQEVLPGWQKGKSAARKKRPVAESTLQRMKKVSLAEAEETLELCERTGVVPICPADDRYPWLLREVPTCPAVLYALGDLRLLTPTTLPFAMVGARDARLSSLSAASDLAGSLARAGFLIVSGGAMLIIGCLSIGGFIGEVLDIENGFERFGQWLKIKSGNAKDKGFVDAFVTASLTVCIGAMAIVGSIEDGIRGDYSILATKAVLDLIIIMVMTCSMGKGCAFSAIPVAALQGTVNLPEGYNLGICYLAELM